MIGILLASEVVVGGVIIGITYTIYLFIYCNIFILGKTIYKRNLTSFPV